MTSLSQVNAGVINPSKIAIHVRTRTVNHALNSVPTLYSLGSANLLWD
jgi:hypothetical protein